MSKKIKKRRRVLYQGYVLVTDPLCPHASLEFAGKVVEICRSRYERVTLCDFAYRP